MTLWQFNAAMDGFVEFHRPSDSGGSGPVAPSAEEFDAVVAAFGE